MIRTLLVLSAAIAALPAAAASIEGVWKVSNGERVEYARCGEAYCSTIQTGPYAGKSVGRMQGAGTSYTGTVTDPTTDKTYEGRAEIRDGVLTLTGCVAKVFCRSQEWTR